MKYERDYSQQKFLEQLQLLDELKNLDTGYTFRIDIDKSENTKPEYFNFTDDDGVRYTSDVDRNKIVCRYASKKIDVDLEVRKVWDKNIEVYIPIHNLKYVSYEDHRIESAKRTKINKMFKLNTKKFVQLVEREVDIYNSLVTLSFERTQTVLDFIKTVRGIGIEVKKSFYNPLEFSGSITKNGIEYQFQIDPNSGHISSSITLSLYDVRNGNYDAVSDLEIFTKLSNNGFKS